AAMIACWRHERAARRFQAIWVPVFAVLMLLAALAPLLLPQLFAPSLQFNSRGWVLVVPALLLAAVIASTIGLLPASPLVRPLLVTILLLAAAAQITWHIAATERWREFLEHTRERLATAPPGLLPYEAAFDRTARPPAFAMLASGWTLPELSIALSPGGRVS